MTARVAPPARTDWMALVETESRRVPRSNELFSSLANVVEMVFPMRRLLSVPYGASSD